MEVVALFTGGNTSHVVPLRECLDKIWKRKYTVWHMSHVKSLLQSVVSILLMGVLNMSFADIAIVVATAHVVTYSKICTRKVAHAQRRRDLYVTWHKHSRFCESQYISDHCSGIACYLLMRNLDIWTGCQEDLHWVSICVEVKYFEFWIYILIIALETLNAFTIHHDYCKGHFEDTSHIEL